MRFERGELVEGGSSSMRKIDSLQARRREHLRVRSMVAIRQSDARGLDFDSPAVADFAASLPPNQSSYQYPSSPLTLVQI